MGKHYRGFWRELIGRSNEYIDTMAIIALVISAPIVVLSCTALIYDIFYLGHGLRDPSVRLLLGLVSASTAGLAASRFSKRTVSEMLGRDRDPSPYVPPGAPPGRAAPAPPQGEKP